MTLTLSVAPGVLGTNKYYFNKKEHLIVLLNFQVCKQATQENSIIFNLKVHSSKSQRSIQTLMLLVLKYSLIETKINSSFILCEKNNVIYRNEKCIMFA